MTSRTALITGSTGGIGKSLVSSLKENVNVISPTRKELDLSSNSSIDDYISSLDIPIDIIVNCAGIHKAGNCEDLTAHDFQNILQINLIAPFQIISGLVKGMKERKYGRILNISSIWSVVSKEKRSIYSASKSGLIGLTKWIAAKYSKNKFTCNMLSPSGVASNQNKSFLKKYIQLLPIGRMATKSEIYGLLKFLISEESNYINGQDILIDGGFSSW